MKMANTLMGLLSAMEWIEEEVGEPINLLINKGQETINIPYFQVFTNFKKKSENIMTSIWNVGLCLTKPPKMHRPLHFNGLVPPGGQWEVHYFEEEKNSWLGPLKHSGYMLVVLLSLCGLWLTNVVPEIKTKLGSNKRKQGDCCMPCLMRSSAALDN